MEPILDLYPNTPEVSAQDTTTAGRYRRDLPTSRKGLHHIFHAFGFLASYKKGHKGERRGNEKALFVSSKCQLISEHREGGGGFAKSAKTL